MAIRPVFSPGKRKNEVDVFMTDFVWNSGLSVSQKRKNIAALHEAFNHRFPKKKVLEISSKSNVKLGVALSAFNLKKMFQVWEKASLLNVSIREARYLQQEDPIPTCMKQHPGMQNVIPA